LLIEAINTCQICSSHWTEDLTFKKISGHHEESIQVEKYMYRYKKYRSKKWKVLHVDTCYVEKIKEEEKK
jgi:hypothetical protein